jgi:hydrogenase maturation protein HypF
LKEGLIVAVQGLGGFQLLVRADCSEAVRHLRKRKRRATKPFAVMVSTLEAAARLGRIHSTEERVLTSPENPIVLLDRLPTRRIQIAPEVAPGLNCIGLLLPTTPLHHILLSELSFPVVATSGNRGEEPIAADKQEAVERLYEIADALLVHDRPILRRVDDSVVRVIGDQPVVLRLARGYAPFPLPAVERLALRRRTKRAVLAVGGQQKAALALWNGAQAVLSPHVGDLDGPLTREAFVQLVQQFADLYCCQLGGVTCDLHPDYFTTRWAEETGLPLTRVQHHHAHAVACMVEHDLLDDEVLAVAWDGTGYGPDGTVWGGEVLRARVGRYQRIASLRPFPLPGGEASIRQPARVAFALAVQTFGADMVLNDTDLLHQLGLSTHQAKTMIRMIARNVNTPWTSSVGRLFDAVASLVLGINQVSYEGEAAVLLEAVVDPAVSDAYFIPLVPDRLDLSFPGERGIPRGDWAPLIRAIVTDLRRGERREVVATRFHQALAEWAAAVVTTCPDLPVVLSGGCFQNAALLTRTRRIMERGGRRVYTHGRIPPGDGGLAAGQLVIALAAAFHENK